MIASIPQLQSAPNYPVILYYAVTYYTECPTTYQTRQFFNNFATNEDIATRFEQEYVRCVRNEKECVCSKIMSICVWMCL